MEFGQQTEEDKPPSYDDVAGDEANVGVTEVGEESVIYQVCKNNLTVRKQSNIGCGWHSKHHFIRRGAM